MVKNRLAVWIAILSLLVGGCAPAPALPGQTAAQGATALPLFTQTPTAVRMPTPAALPHPPSQFRVVAYYPYWSLSTRQYGVEDIPAAALTHLNYAFAAVSSQGECVSTNASADAVNFPALKTLKLRYPKLKTLISIGGGSSGAAFSKTAVDDESRAHLVQSCVAFMQVNGFDGIDVDWEYPQAGETQAFTSLLNGLRQALDILGKTDGHRYLLTIAAPAGPWQMAHIDFTQVTPLVDWFNLMTYDFYGDWSSTTGFNAPLYPSTPDPAHLSADTTVQAYLAAGVPANKLVLGLPFFSHAWQGVATTNNGLYQPFGKPALGTFDDYSLQESRFSTFTRYWDDEAKVPWLYDPAQGIMISYDDVESLGFKSAYIRDHKLGGAMIWQIAEDDATNTLLKGVIAGLQP